MFSAKAPPTLFVTNPIKTVTAMTNIVKRTLLTNIEIKITITVTIADINCGKACEINCPSVSNVSFRVVAQYIIHIV